MLLDLSKLIAALEGHTAALLSHASALVSGGAETPKATRGRKAVGEVNGVAQTVEQVAASTLVTTAAVQAAASAPTVAATAAAGTASDVPVVKTAKTLQQVADKIVALVNSPTGGRDKAVAILTKYGVKKVPELKPEQFDAVWVDLEAAEAPASGAASLF